MPQPRILILFYFFFVLATPTFAQTAIDSSSVTVLRAYVEAYNRHDVDKLMTLVSDDFAYFSVAGDSMQRDIHGSALLREWLTGYFHSLPTVRSVIEDIFPCGTYLAMRERAIWQSKKGERSQVAIGVYEISNGRIRRAWYFPAQKI